MAAETSRLFAECFETHAIELAQTSGAALIGLKMCSRRHSLAITSARSCRVVQLLSFSLRGLHCKPEASNVPAVKDQRGFASVPSPKQTQASVGADTLQDSLSDNLSDGLDSPVQMESSSGSKQAQGDSPNDPGDVPDIDLGAADTMLAASGGAENSKLDSGKGKKGDKEAAKDADPVASETALTIATGGLAAIKSGVAVEKAAVTVAAGADASQKGVETGASAVAETSGSIMDGMKGVLKAFSVPPLSVIIPIVPMLMAISAAWDQHKVKSAFAKQVLNENAKVDGSKDTDLKASVEFGLKGATERIYSLIVNVVTTTINALSSLLHLIPGLGSVIAAGVKLGTAIIGLGKVIFEQARKLWRWIGGERGQAKKSAGVVLDAAADGDEGSLETVRQLCDSSKSDYVMSVLPGLGKGSAARVDLKDGSGIKGMSWAKAIDNDKLMAQLKNDKKFRSVLQERLAGKMKAEG
ncbi:MAG: hypothetical protein ACJATT_004940 [Myxococcota bacterium]|jgi:hypothetical protein